MKRILNKLGFRKMDEMERHIAFKAQRNAYLFLMVALLFWTFYERYQVFVYESKLNMIPSILLYVAAAIQIISQLVITHGTVKDEDTDKAPPWLRILMWIGAIVAIAGSAMLIGAALLVAGAMK